MAKDDYYVIVYKILAYLYVQLKAGEDIDSEMISHDSQIININEKYWNYIMRNLVNDGYITCDTTKAWGDVIIFDLNTAEITPLGIEYLSDNTLFEKVKAFLKDMKEITPFV